MLKEQRSRPRVIQFRGSADASSEGVQRDLLPLIEGSQVATGPRPHQGLEAPSNKSDEHHRLTQPPSWFVLRVCVI